jgi:hypothetical protein
MQPTLLDCHPLNIVYRFSIKLVEQTTHPTFLYDGLQFRAEVTETQLIELTYFLLKSHAREQIVDEILCLFILRKTRGST